MCNCIIISAWHSHEDLERRVAKAIGARVMIRGPLTQFLCWCDVWVMVDQDSDRVRKDQKHFRRLEKQEWWRIVKDCSVYQSEWSCLIADRCLLHEDGEQSCPYGNHDPQSVRKKELPVIGCSGAPQQCLRLASTGWVRVL